MKKFLPSICCWDLNPQPLDHESPRKTTSPEPSKQWPDWRNFAKSGHTECQEQ